MDTCIKSKHSNRVIGAHDQGGQHEQNNDSNYGNQNYSLHGTMAAADYLAVTTLIPSQRIACEASESS